MKLQVQIRHVYGKETIYPACETAAKFVRLQGRKTFIHSDLETLKLLGVTIELMSHGIVVGLL